jgi:LysM repeat protein
MSIVRAARDDAPASHLPSPAVAVPQPRRSEPAAALPGNPPSAARTSSTAASSCSGRAARSGSVGAPAAPGPARPATPSRQHVRAVLTGSPRSARSAPRLRIVRPSDQPAAYRSPATTRPGITQPSDRPGQPPAQPGQPAVHAPAQPAQVPAGAGQVPARSARVSAQPGQAQSRPGAARPGIARTGAARSSAAAPRSLQLTAARPHPAPPSGLRLTRRGRLVLSVFALALILGLITILWATLANGVQAASGRSHTGSVYQGLHRVTVLPGQTLWAIAQRAEPSADPRTVIPEIMQINAISSTDLQPGQQLWVPGS